MNLTLLSGSVRRSIIFVVMMIFCSGCSSTLLSAACDGETDKVRSLLQNGTPVNQGRELWCASFHGYNEIVQLLLQHHADPNKLYKDHENDIPLIAAVGADSFEISKALLDHGALVDVSDKEGRTALAMASLRENRPIIELLLSRGAGVELAHKHLEKFAATNTYCNLRANNARAILDKCKRERSAFSQ